MEQVITIAPDGSIETLRQKKGQGVDLRAFGEVQMERVSEVLLDEDKQEFYVRFLKGPLAGLEVSEGLYGLIAETDFVLSKADERKLFPDYEDAVQAEILIWNFVSLNGTKINIPFKRLAGIAG